MDDEQNLRIRRSRPILRLLDLAPQSSTSTLWYALKKIGQTVIGRDQEVANFESSSIAIGYGRRTKFTNSPVAANQWRHSFLSAYTL